MPTGVGLRPAEPDDGEYVETLLAGNDLPAADLSARLDCLPVWEAGAKRVGVCGLERHGDDGLVRSVVEGPACGTGYGTDACEELLDRAGAAGTTIGYLLTTTAEGFFERLGFGAVVREVVPESIRTTSEFDDLRPATAVYMKRELAGRPSPGSLATDAFSASRRPGTRREIHPCERIRPSGRVNRWVGAGPRRTHRTGRADRADWAGRADRVDWADRTDRADRTDQADRTHTGFPVNAGGPRFR